MEAIRAAGIWVEGKLDRFRFGELDMARWGLVPVAKIDHYKGLWFATFDARAPTLPDYLGEMTWYLDSFFDRREGGIEVIGGIHKWILPCNWKFPAENFAGGIILKYLFELFSVSGADQFSL